MKTFENILILTDLDGTFFGHGTEIPEVNREAIARFKALGGRFTLATGRSYPTIDEMIPDVAALVNAPMITGNGTVIYDPNTKTVLREKDFDAPPAFWDFVRAIADRYPISYRAHTKAGVSPNYDCTDQMPKDPPKCQKLVFWHKDEEKTPLFPQIRTELETFAPHLHYSHSCPVLLEVLPKHATKGEAVADLRAMLAPQGKQITVYGVGDYENDLTMLCACDVAACPANAQESVKAVCQYRLCHHTEGAIADLIGRLLAESDQ